MAAAGTGSGSRPTAEMVVAGSRRRGWIGVLVLALATLVGVALGLAGPEVSPVMPTDLMAGDLTVGELAGEPAGDGFGR